MRVVATGGAGFIVGATVRRLLAGGVDSLPSTGISRGRARSPLPAPLVRDDLRDLGRLAERFRGADAVVHAAGSCRVGITAAGRPATEEPKVGATARALDAAAAAGVHRRGRATAEADRGSDRARTTKPSAFSSEVEWSHTLP